MFVSPCHCNSTVADINAPILSCRNTSASVVNILQSTKAGSEASTESDNSCVPVEGDAMDSVDETSLPTRGASVSELLHTPGVGIGVAAYCALSFVSIVYDEIFPLW